MKNHYVLLCLLVTILTQAQTYKIVYDDYYNDKLITNTNLLVLYAQKYYALEITESASKKFPEISTYYNFIENNQVKKAELKLGDTIFSEPIAINQNLNLLSETKKIKGYNCKLATTTINSNHIKIWYTNDLDVKGSPKNIGSGLGLVLEIIINDNTKISAASIKKLNTNLKLDLPKSITYLNSIDFEYEIWKTKFEQINIFDSDTINFNDKINTKTTITKYAKGTVITKKVKIPKLGQNDQVFIDLTTFSQGDAYDRTGSVFMIIPEKNKKNFEEALINGIEALPLYNQNTQTEYRGFTLANDYTPAIELMRFFTPFGIQKYNHIQQKNKHWNDKVFYRQDISELNSFISNKEIIIGTYIGNYDSNGHNVTLNLSIHKENTHTPKYTQIISLFNTVNILEMAGQNYATLFNDEQGLLIKFTLDTDLKEAKLRYITTGHGG